MPSTQLSLDDFCAGIGAIARATIDNHGDLQPLVWLFDVEWTLHLILLDGDGEQQAAVIEREAAALNAVAAVYVGDTWVSKRAIRPSQDPERTEALVMSRATLGGKMEIQMWPYTRQPDGSIKWDDGDELPWTETEFDRLLRWFRVSRS